MSRYAMLILPSANRVYAGEASSLTLAELAVAGQALGSCFGDLTATTIGGVEYVTFEAAELDPPARAVLADLSARYALFEVQGELLRPVELRRSDCLAEDLLTIPRYSGKTNEQFTKLLFNVTLLTSAYATAVYPTAPEPARRLVVVDPLCGRGTTLSQALVYGHHAVGIEIDRASTEAYGTFLRTWLQRKRLKHRFEEGALRRHRTTLGRRLHVTLAASREQWAAADAQELTVLTVDTVAALDHLGRESAHLVVTDLPYGVQHASRSPRRAAARNPLELLTAAAPGWAALLRPGGALGLSWNALATRRQDVVAALSEAGLTVVDDEPYRGFRHRVDQAVVRDLVVARVGQD